MQIEVTVERMLCAKKEKKWYFFRAAMGNTSVICKGGMGWEPQVLETLALVGDWVEYRGERHFQFKAAKLTLPLDPRSQLRYVCDRTCGVGPAIEEAIWEARGKEWRKLERGEIRKMSDAAFNSFREQLQLFDANSEKAEVIAWLENKGCSELMAAAAFETWGNDTAGVVNTDCYRLASLSGFSFRTVDENVRRNFDIADDDPRRIRAAVTYALEQETGDGSTAVDCWRHFSACQKLLPNLSSDMIQEQAREMAENNLVKVFRKYCKISLPVDHLNERIIYEAVSASCDAKPDPVELDFAALAAGEKFTPDETQVEAARHAITHKFAIINGGAGVGKTTIIKMIVSGLKIAFPKLTVRLCAPTGKAAARLKEASGIEATTIHSMLCSKGDGIFSAGPLTECAIIVDESSMVDSALLAEIMKRTPARLVLVGDQAQLTPVGHGQPFHDLIQIFPEAIRTLTKCYRNTEAVFQAATQIRSGNLPPRNTESENERWIMLQANRPQEAQERICAWARDGYLDFGTDIVLCPKNGKKGEDDAFQDATVNAFNEELLQIDREKRGMLNGDKFAPGDRVINTKNCPDEQVWNGTTGTVHAVNDEKEIFVKLDVPITDPVSGETKDIVRFDKEMIKSLRHAYALTVHKSQGSQYRRVVIVILARDGVQLDRSLVYTAVTRTKAECVVIGDFNAFGRAIQTIRKKETVLQMLYLEEHQEGLR